MPVPVKGSVGILPAGALGVSFFYHLTNQLQKIDGTVFFLERSGSSSFQGLRSKGELVIADSRLTHRIKSGSLLQPDLLASYQRGSLPELVLACPNPDQLLGIISECVRLLEAA